MAGTPEQKLIHYLGYRNDPVKWAAYLERKRKQRLGLRLTTPLKPLSGDTLGFQGIPDGHEIKFWLDDEGQPCAGLANEHGRVIGPLPATVRKEIAEFGRKYRPLRKSA